MAAKEKGKIVSASPDSPTLEKLSTFSQQIRSALHCFAAVATRTNALWQRVDMLADSFDKASQPARMRCGKVLRLCFSGFYRHRRNPHECAVAKKPVNNAAPTAAGRNPHECAVAKGRYKPLGIQGSSRNPHECAVAKSRHCYARTGNSESMNYVLLF